MSFRSLEVFHTPSNNDIVRPAVFSFLINLKFFPICFWRLGGCSVKTLYGMRGSKLPFILQVSWEFISWIFSIHSRLTKRSNIGRCSWVNVIHGILLLMTIQIGTTSSSSLLRKPFPLFLAKFTYPLGLCLDIIFFFFSGKALYTAPTLPSPRLPALLGSLPPSCHWIRSILELPLYCLYFLGYEIVSCHLHISSI